MPVGWLEETLQLHRVHHLVQGNWSTRPQRVLSLSALRAEEPGCRRTLQGTEICSSILELGAKGTRTESWNSLSIHPLYVNGTAMAFGLTGGRNEENAMHVEMCILSGTG